MNATARRYSTHESQTKPPATCFTTTPNDDERQLSSTHHAPWLERIFERNQDIKEGTTHPPKKRRSTPRYTETKRIPSSVVL